MSLFHGMEIPAVIAFAVALAFVTRVWSRFGGHEYAIDTWYFLLCVDELRRTKRLPIYLPYFLLDIDEQWYPPGFAIFMSLFSPRTLERIHWLVSPVLEAAMGGVAAWAACRVSGSPAAGLAAAIIYAFIPTNVLESAHLNSRIIGHILFTATMLCGLAAVQFHSIPLTAAFFAIAYIMVMTHKLSTQNFAFLLLCFSVAHLSFAYLGLLIGVIVVCFVLTRGFYWKILKGHVEILLYWRNNLPWLGAHQVYGSPVYQREDKPQGRLFYSAGIKGLAKTCLRIIDNNFFIIYFTAAALLGGYAELTAFQKLLAQWVFFTYLFASLTMLVPPLRFMGEGIKYIKLAGWPMALLGGVWLASSGGDPIHIALFAVCLALNLWKIRLINLGFRNDPGNIRMLSGAMEFLKGRTENGVLCLPVHIADAVAYFTRKKVCWGAHSSGYDKMHDFNPVLRKRIEWFFEKYPMKFLLIDTKYVAPEHLELPGCFEKAFSDERYVIYEYTVAS